MLYIQLKVIHMTQNFMRGLKLIKLFHYNKNINRINQLTNIVSQVI